MKSVRRNKKELKKKIQTTEYKADEYWKIKEYQYLAIFWRYGVLMNSNKRLRKRNYKL